VQPVNEFYKDEGGKGNWMSCVLVLKGVSLPLAKRFELQPVLFFESGVQVESHDQKILRVKPILSAEDISELGENVDIEPTAVPVKFDAATGETVAQFRIEKVSRRKDNQKFMVQWEVKGHPNFGRVFTTPVTVYSKRKIPAALRGNPEAIAQHKALKRASRKRARAKKNEVSTDVAVKRAKLSLARSNAVADALAISRSQDTAESISELHTKIDSLTRCLDQVYSLMKNQRVQMNHMQKQLWQLQSQQAVDTVDPVDAINPMPQESPVPARSTRIRTSRGKHHKLDANPESSPRGHNLWTGLALLSAARSDTPDILAPSKAANKLARPERLYMIDIDAPSSPFPTPAIKPLDINM